MSFEELASRLTGPFGSNVDLHFSRGPLGSVPYEFEVGITRGSKPQPPSFQPTTSAAVPNLPGYEYVVVSIPRIVPASGTISPDGISGVGITFTMSEHPPYQKIVAVKEGGGAAKTAAVLPGDLVATIDGQNLHGRQMQDIINMMRGPIGSNVAVGILRSSVPTSMGPVSVSSPQLAGAPTGAGSIVPPFSLDQSNKGQAQGGTKSIVLVRAAVQGLPPGNGGVGIVWDKDAQSGALTVSHLVEGGPAHRSGKLALGDALVAVNGRPVSGLDRDAVLAMLTGPIQSTVTLDLRPSNNTVPQQGMASCEMAVCTKDAATLAEEARLARLVRLTNQSWGDTLLLWIVHVLLVTMMALVLVYTGSVQVSFIDVNKSYVPIAELQAAFTVQGYLYALAPFGVLFALHLLELIGMMFSTLAIGRMATHYIFGNRAGLVSLALFGNIFVATSALLLFFYLARPACCDVVAPNPNFMPIILSPMFGGIILYFIWSAFEIYSTHPGGHARHLRRKIFPTSDLIMQGVLAVLVIVAMVLLWLRAARITTFSWLLSMIPLHLSIFLIFFSAIYNAATANKRMNPIAERRLAAVGIIDSLTFAVLEILIFVKLDFPLFVFAWEYYWTIPLAFMATSYTVWLVWDIMAIFMCPHNPPQPHDFFEAKAQKIIAPAGTNDLRAQITWPVPGHSDGHNEPPAEHKVETSLDGRSWMQQYLGPESVVSLYNLPPSSSIRVRVSAYGGGAGRGILNTVGVIELPSREEVQKKGVAKGVHTPAQRPADTRINVAPLAPSRTASAATQMAQMGVPAIMIPPMVPAAPALPAPPRPALLTGQGAGIGAVSGPLFLKDLQAAGDGQMFGVFEWLHQKHFAANILDLELVVAGDGSEAHDYTMVYAGTENVVRIYNILPGSYYRMRLRAGDFEDNDLRTVVERAVLPFATPSLSALARDGSAAATAVALGAAGPPAAARPFIALPASEPQNTLAPPPRESRARNSATEPQPANFPVVIPTTSSPPSAPPPMEGALVLYGSKPRH